MNASDNFDLKEIRFTRSGQSVTFFLISIGLFAIGVGVYVLSVDFGWESQPPRLDSPWWGLIALPFVVASGWLGLHLAKHAYMIFSPVGIEVFPFYKPSDNMQVLYWSEVLDVDLTDDGKMLEVTLLGEGEHRPKVIITTAPLSPNSRKLMTKTIAGIRQQREVSS